MAEQNPYAYDNPGETEPAKRGGVNAFTLIAGIATLLVSAYVLSDGASWLPSFDFRWVIAGGPVARTEAFHRRRADRLVATIGHLGPAFVKLAQLFAARPDLATALAAEFSGGQPSPDA